MKFEALLRAHGFMNTERPPELWEADTELERFVPLLGEMIAAGLSGGSILENLTLSVSNIVVENDSDADPVHEPVPGEYVGVTVSGVTNFGPDARWQPGAVVSGRLMELDERLKVAGVRFAYIRRIENKGSFTVFLNRSRT